VRSGEERIRFNAGDLKVVAPIYLPRLRKPVDTKSAMERRRRESNLCINILFQCFDDFFFGMRNC